MLLGPRFKSYQLEESRIKMVCPWGLAFLWMFVVVLLVLPTDVNVLCPCFACLCDKFLFCIIASCFFNRQRELLGFLLQGAACVRFRAWVLVPLKGAAVVPV